MKNMKLINWLMFTFGVSFIFMAFIALSEPRLFWALEALGVLIIVTGIFGEIYKDTEHLH